MFTSKNYQDILYVNSYSVFIGTNNGSYVIYYSNDKNKPTQPWSWLGNINLTS